MNISILTYNLNGYFNDAGLKSNLYNPLMISNPFVSWQYLSYKTYINIQIFIWNFFFGFAH